MNADERRKKANIANKLKWMETNVDEGILMQMNIDELRLMQMTKNLYNLIQTTLNSYWIQKKSKFINKKKTIFLSCLYDSK